MGAVVKDSEGQVVSDLTQWQTRSEVCEELGVSTSTVKRMQRNGVLTPVQDAEGINRYEPRQVAEVLEVQRLTGKIPMTHTAMQLATHPAVSDHVARVVPDAYGPGASDDAPMMPPVKTTGDPAFDFVGYTLGMLERMLARPRADLDRRLFQVIDSQKQMIEQLAEAQTRYLNKLREVEAEDVERRTAAKILEGESEVKAEAIKRATSTLEKLVSGGRNPLAPAGWSDQKLAELAQLDVWSAEEAQAIASEIHRRARASAEANAKSNGAPDAKKGAA